MGSSFTRQVPSLPAVADFTWPRNSTVTRSPGSAFPQTGTAISRCKTIWLENSRPTLTRAETAAAQASRRHKAEFAIVMPQT